MTDVNEDIYNMSRSAFPRIARHLNYRRSFLTPTSARVDLPGFPYEAFDNTGTKIKPWSLLRLFESVRAFTFWENVSKDSPNQSLLDMQTLYQDHQVFIVDTNVEISPQMYQASPPKYPLYVLTQLKSVGRSSRTISYELRHSGNDVLYASCEVSDVLVDRKSRKPVAYPQWWMTTYGNACQNAMSKMQLDAEPDKNLFVSKFIVYPSEIDTNKHTNWTTYVKYCYETVYNYAQAGMYGNVTVDHLDAGLKSFGVVYKNEANFGDELLVTSWEDKQRDNFVNFSIKCNNLLCCQSRMEFYTSDNIKPHQPETSGASKL